MSRFHVQLNVAPLKRHQGARHEPPAVVFPRSIERGSIEAMSMTVKPGATGVSFHVQLNVAPLKRLARRAGQRGRVEVSTFN